MILEVCTSNYQSALNAQKAGAHRIELCSELAVGGITPSYGLLKKTIQNLKIQVFVLIRPRSGNFTYSEAEFEIMKQDLQMCKDLGCHGIVSGVLNPDNTIDIERTKALVALAHPLPFTFHRAFDWTPDPYKALTALKALKVNRVLTSGQANTAENGISLLKELKKQAHNELLILPGSGINPKNVLIFKQAGFAEVHCSAVSKPDTTFVPPVPMNTPSFLNDGQEMTSQLETIASIHKLIQD